jgi:hypothetical protein
MGSLRAYYLPTGGDPIEDWHNSTFEPIAELHRKDADTHIALIQKNGLTFSAPNDDPLYAAHQTTTMYFDNNTNRTTYKSDKSASILGCAEQVYTRSP